MADADTAPLAVPRQVHCELETLRQMGTHDLLSADVLDVLERYDFEATRSWALEHPDAYVHAAVNGTVDETRVDAPTRES